MGPFRFQVGSLLRDPYPPGQKSQTSTGHLSFKSKFNILDRFHSKKLSRKNQTKIRLNCYEKTAPAFDISIQLVGFRAKYLLADKEDSIDFTIQEAREKLTPEQVLEILKAGNRRFVEGHPLDRSLLKSSSLSAAQKNSSAIATIVSGIDSQTPVELIFDLGVGEAFVIRTPGVVIGPRAIGGVEFAVSQGGAKLVVVMGHADSSLLSLAIENAGSPENKAQLAGCEQLQEVLEQIAISIEAKDAEAFPRMSIEAQQDLRKQVAHRHIARMSRMLVQQSPVLSRQLSTGQIQVVTAMFDSSSGAVEFLK